MKTLLKFLLLVATVVFLTWLFVNYASATAVKKNDESIPLGLRAAATRVCALWGFKDIRCRNDQLAIAWMRSKWNVKLREGCYVGIMKLNICNDGRTMHPDIAWNPEQAMYYVLNTLVNNGYPENRERAIRIFNCKTDENVRNGCGTSFYFRTDVNSRWYEYPQE